MANYNLGEARGKIILETDLKSLKEGQQAIDNAKSNVEKSAGAQQEAWKKTGTAATVAGATIVGAFGLAVKSASDFEFQMSAIQAVSGATSKEMDLIRDAALRIGKDTSFSASEAAQAMEELVKAGISTKDVLGGAADATVALAAAGGVDLPTAATIAANAMNQFNLGAKDLVGVTDKIAGAANASAIDVGDFAQSISQVGAVANLAGLSFNDTALAIAAMGNAGIKGSDAGTSLKTMLQNLQPTTKKQIALFQELGLMQLDVQKSADYLTNMGFAPLSTSSKDLDDAFMALAESMAGPNASAKKISKEYEKLVTNTDLSSNAFYDQNGKLKSLTEISDVLGGALEGMSSAQKSMALETIFGTDAIRAAAVVADTGSKGFEDLAASMDKTSAAEVAATRMDNMKGSLEALGGSVETLMIEIGSALIPVIRQIIDSISSAVDWFTSLDDGTRNLITTAALLTGGLLLVFGVVVKMSQAMLTMRSTFLALTGAQALFNAEQGKSVAGMVAQTAKTVASTAAMIAQKTAMVAMSVASKAAAAAQWLFNAAMNANPIMLIITAITALVAGLVWFFTQTDVGRKIWQGFITWLQQAWTNIGNFFATVWNGMLAVGQAVWNGIMAVVQPVVDWFQTYVWPIIQFVIDAIVAYFQMYYNVVSAIWNAVATAVGAVIDFFQQHVQPAIDAFVGFITKLFNYLLSVVQVVWQAIADWIKSIVDPIVKWLTNVWNTFKLGWNLLWKIVGQTVQDIWNNIVKWIKSIVDPIVNWLTDTWHNFQLGWKIIWDTVKSTITTVWNAIKSFIEPIVSGIRNFISNTWNALTGIVSGIFEKVKDAIMKPIQSALDFIGGIKDKIVGFFKGAGTWLYDIGKTIIQGFLDGLKAMWDNITGFFTNLTNMIPDKKGPPEKDKVLLTKNGQLIMQSLYNGLASEMGNVEELLNGMNATIPATINQDVMANVNGGRGMRPIQLSVEWHAAPNDEVSTKEQVMDMLGHASELVREELG